MKATLTRSYTGDQGTFGSLRTPSGFTCYTAELPWRQNAEELSCVAMGIYSCRWRYSETKGYCFHVDGVVGRRDILIHAGNLAGDVTKGFLTDSRGCILVGTSIGFWKGQEAVLDSRLALTALEADLGYHPFDLVVIESF